jgi:hypothetical protein
MVLVRGKVKWTGFAGGGGLFARGVCWIPKG